MRDDQEYASETSFLGMLQRGRGEAAHRALSEPDAAEMVVACVIADNRWDHQTEERALYLSRLVRSASACLSPLESYLLDPAIWVDTSHWSVALLVQVLRRLTAAGNRDATRTLHRYLTEAHGRNWVQCVEDLWEDPKERSLLDGLETQMLDRIDDDLLHRVVEPRYGPWTEWSKTQPRVRQALEAREASRQTGPMRPKVLVRGRTEEELTDVILGGPPGRTAREAWGELARYGAAVLDLAESPHVRNQLGAIPGLAVALRVLGVQALPRARHWIGGADENLSRFAVGVLADWGIESDAPLILALFRSAAATNDWYQAEELAGCLGRLQVREAIADLAAAWQETIHSHARALIVRALHRIDAEAAQDLVSEGLWDCESEVREFACANARLTPAAQEQLRYMAVDRSEVATVRAAAARRLGA